MKIRILKSSDTDSVFNIFRETWLETYPNKEFWITKEHINKKYDSKERYESIKKYISDFSDEKIWYGVEINWNLVWVWITNMMWNKCHIWAIYILPKYQKRWYWKLLLDKLLEFRKNFKEIYLEVWIYNENAIRFYEKNWFEIINWSEWKHKIIDNVFIPTIMMKRQNKDMF